MAISGARLSSDVRAPGGPAFHRNVGGVVVGPILNASKLKALLLADGNSTRKSKTLDLSHSNIRKVALSLGEVAALDFECLTDLDLHCNLLVSLDGHSLPFPHLQNLRASNCRIGNLTNFGSHFRLRQLDLSGNQLTHIMGLANTPLRFTLQGLRIASNHIRDFKGLAPLSTFEALETLDLRGNPLSNFGIVAEGFALLCCHSLRQLNGRTVSEDVRGAVDTWAVDDLCGRATAATVKAFRDALLLPEGPSLLAATKKPHMGRITRPERSDDSPENIGNRLSSAAADSLPDTDGSESSITGQQTLGKNKQSAASVSHISSGRMRERRAAATRASLSEVQAAVKEPSGVQNADIGSLTQEVKITESYSSTYEDTETRGGGQCCISSNVQLNFKKHVEFSKDDACANDGFSSPSVSPDLLEHMSRVGVSRGNIESGSCEPCKLCLCQPIRHGQCYRSRDQHGYVIQDLSENKISSNERICANTDCIRCCAGTQTPAGWICPLDLPSSSRSLSSNSAKKSDAEVESEI